MLGPGSDDVTAHVHIDALPKIRGRGRGRLLIRTLLAGLDARGTRGARLGVGEGDLGALVFSARLGFLPLPAGS